MLFRSGLLSPLLETIDMWRQTDSWFEIRFSDNTQGFAHLSSAGKYLSVYKADGNRIGEQNVEYTCVNDNVDAPNWYIPEPVVEPIAEQPQEEAPQE